MLQELTLTPATVVIVLLVLAWAVWAVRRLTKRGMCDCGDKCDSCSHKSGSTDGQGCSHCSAAEDMVARIESSLQKQCDTGGSPPCHT